MRLKLVPKETKFNFFDSLRFWLGLSAFLIIVACGSLFAQSLNFGIDFLGGTSIRTQSTKAVDVGIYRNALRSLDVGDINITEVFDPNFDVDQHVAMIRIQQQNVENISVGDLTRSALKELKKIDPNIIFVSVESIGPKVSGELIKAAIIAVALAIGAVLIYIWLRFEWQFAQGAVVALIHDVVLTIGIFSIIKIKFDLAIIAALLTIVGYSLNDTVVVFDRVRENLRKYKKSPLKELLNLSINETLSRTVATSVTTLLALIALFTLGGDVIRGFVFAMICGVIIGTYSSIFIASSTLLWLGVKRDWSKPNAEAGTKVPQE